MSAITQRADGRFVSSLTVDGRRIYVYGHSKSECSSKIKAMQVQADRQTLRPPTNQTVEKYLLWWLETVESSLKATTLESYSELLNLHVVPALGRIKLERLSAADLTGLYARKLKEGLSPRRVGMVHACLRKALNDAVRMDLIGSNPSQKTTAPKVSRVEPELWTEEELRRFVQDQIANPHPWSQLWLTLLGTGMRLGEALGLTWDSINFETGTIDIRRAIVWVNGAPTVSTPKTRSSVRVISLPTVTVRALREQRRKQATDRLHTGQEWPDQTGYVFLSDNGRHPRLQNLRRFFLLSCKRATVPGIRIHDLRHLSASVLAQSGVDVKSVQKRLGHANISTTLNVYSHVLAKGDSKLSDCLDVAFGAG